MSDPEGFEIVAELGEGAFARVVRARDKATGKEAALKILKEAFADDAQAIERLRREVLAVRAIDSAHVVKLHDAGGSGGALYIAMEYVEGPTLRELLRGRPWPAEATRVVIGQVAEALAAAHAVGIVHRDLKPENVMLVGGARGRTVKVLDFGLAKLVAMERRQELEPLTQAGRCFGTPQYMAPEQAAGREATPAADLWALGVMAYELLSGRLPWDGGEPRDVLRALVTAELPALGTLHPTVTGQRAALERFFATALAKAPAARPADAAAFFAALEEALGGHARAAGAAGAPFAAVAAAELADAEVQALGMSVGAGAGTAVDGTGTGVGQPLGAFVYEQSVTTLPGKLGGADPGRRLHSMWSMSLSTLPPLSPGDSDEAPLLAAPPVVRKSGSNRVQPVEPAAAAPPLLPSLVTPRPSSRAARSVGSWWRRSC